MVDLLDCSKIIGYLCQYPYYPQIYNFAKDTKKKDTNILGAFFQTMHFLGKNLRHLRKQSAKTQSEIASLIQKGQTTIGNWENGISEPSLNELLIISNYFDIPLDTLLKVDLSETQPSQLSGQGADRPYDHSGKELPQMEEEETTLVYLLKKMQNMEQEIRQINSRLPAPAGDLAPDQKNSGQS